MSGVPSPKNCPVRLAPRNIAHPSRREIRGSDFACPFPLSLKGRCAKGSSSHVNSGVPCASYSVHCTLSFDGISCICRGCKESALEGVIRVFDRLDAAAEATDQEDAAGGTDHIPIRRGHRLGASSSEELRSVEGTILLHFNFAMKQDHNLASCVLKGFQRRGTAPEVGRAFTPFRVALLLSLSRIQRFRQPVLDLVQDVVCECLVYDHLREGAAWLENEEELARSHRHGHGSANRGDDRARAKDDADGSDGERGDGPAFYSSAEVVESVLLRVVRYSRGWDHLVGSLLKLGLQLLDRGGGTGGGSPGGGRGASSAAADGRKGMLERLHGSESQRAALRASHLGRVVLMETFKTHEARRVSI